MQRTELIPSTNILDYGTDDDEQDHSTGFFSLSQKKLNQR